MNIHDQGVAIIWAFCTFLIGMAVGVLAGIRVGHYRTAWIAAAWFAGAGVIGIIAFFS